jgi:hypothetical protein
VLHIEPKKGVHPLELKEELHHPNSETLRRKMLSGLLMSLLLMVSSLWPHMLGEMYILDLYLKGGEIPLPPHTLTHTSTSSDHIGGH